MITNYILKIGLSLLLSGLIGLEREKANKEAGLRTIMAISLGATLTVLFVQEVLARGMFTQFDEVRLIAYYIVAVGFGSTIRKQEGVTTSAILLPLSCIGFLCGIGSYVLAIISTLCVYLILMLKYFKFKVVSVKKRKKRKKK